MKRQEGGFTLIEVLLATVLLAAGLALAFATLRSATAVGASGEAMAERNESIRAAEGFLRQRLASALPMGYGQDKETGQVIRFSGDARQLRFVADLPDYLGRGGPYLHHIAFDGEQRLQASFAMVQNSQTVEEKPPRAPEPLADGLRAVRFRYRGPDEQGKLGPWQDDWKASERLPLQVSMQVQDARGDWPELVVSLPQGTVQALPADPTGGVNQ